MTAGGDTSDGAPRQPGIPTERFEKVEIATVDELRDWLQVNYAREEGVWLVTGKKSAGERFIDRWDMLDQLLCFGWVDGIRRKLDETRTMQLITPRRQQTWALTYKERVKKLEEAGQMTDAGRAAIKRSKKLGLWNATAKVDALAPVLRRCGDRVPALLDVVGIGKPQSSRLDLAFRLFAQSIDII